MDENLLNLVESDKNVMNKLYNEIKMCIIKCWMIICVKNLYKIMLYYINGRT